MRVFWIWPSSPATALSHGVARYAFLQHGEQTDATEQAFVRTLADSILKDFCYKNIVRNDILNFVRSELQGNADNFWTPDIDREAVLDRAGDRHGRGRGPGDRKPGAEQFHLRAAPR